MSESQPIPAEEIIMLQVPFRVHYKQRAYADLAKTREVVQKEVLNRAGDLATSV